MRETFKRNLGRPGWHEGWEAGDACDGLGDFALPQRGGGQRSGGATERSSYPDILWGNQALGCQACYTTQMGGTKKAAGGWGWNGLLYLLSLGRCGCSMIACEWYVFASFMKCIIARQRRSQAFTIITALVKAKVRSWKPLKAKAKRSLVLCIEYPWLAMGSSSLRSGEKSFGANSTLVLVTFWWGTLFLLVV